MSATIPFGLTDSFKEEGLWWVKGREDNQVGGTLTFDPADGPLLTLLGMLYDVKTSMKAAFEADDKERPTIYGVTKNGRPVTLLRSINKRRQFNMPGIANEAWVSDLLVIGFHLDDENTQEIFSKSYARFECIEKWLGHEPFSVTQDVASEKTLTVTVCKSKEVQFASHKDFAVTSVASLYSTNNPNTKYTIDVYSQLGVIPHSSKSLKWHFTQAVRLQELAALCTGHFLPLLSLELHGPVEVADEGHSYPSVAHVYVRMMNPGGTTRLGHASPLLSGPELLAFNSEAIQNWFDQYEILKPAIGLFFMITGQREMLTNIRFILAVQALEVFHRRTTNESIMSPADYAEFKQQLTERIPTSATNRMREKLRGTYEFLNEPSLAQRLKSIVADLTASFGVVPPAFDKGYLRKLVATRNYYTHFSQELVDEKLDGAGMHWATRRIVLLFSLLFLLRLGVGANDLTRLLKRHSEFSRLWSAGDSGIDSPQT